MSEFVTPKQAAGMLGISLRKVWALIREGKLPVLYFGPRSRRIPVAALVEMAKGRENVKEWPARGGNRGG